MRYVIIFILILLLGCEVDSNQNITTEEYTHLKYNFYRNAKGTLFEKKYGAIDNPEMKRPTWYDSTLFFPNYPLRVPLSKIIDIDSYIELGQSNYSRDKNNVYFTRATSDGAFRFIVQDADPGTFIATSDRQGQDNDHKFLDDEILKIDKTDLQNKE